MKDNINFKELNLLCLHYLLGKLTSAEELKLKERLKNERHYKQWFDWLMLKWLKTGWLRRNITSYKK